MPRTDARLQPIEINGSVEGALGRFEQARGRVPPLCKMIGQWAGLLLPSPGTDPSLGPGQCGRWPTQGHPNPFAKDGAVPSSERLAAGSALSPLFRRAFIPAMVRRAASLRASLAGLRHGSVPRRKGQEGQSTIGQRATSLA